MNVYCPNLQVDYCNLLMIKVMQIKNIYENEVIYNVKTLILHILAKYQRVTPFS